MSASSTSAKKESDPAASAAPSVKRHPPAYTRFKQQLILASGIIFLLCLIVNTVPIHAWLQIFLLSILTTLVGLMSVRLPSGSELVCSPTIPLVFAIGGLFGATAAVLVAVLSTFMAGYTSVPKEKKMAFRTLCPFRLYQCFCSGQCEFVLCRSAIFSFSASRCAPGRDT